jgi:hypothetical protein
MDLADCDKCWAKGGAFTEAGEEWCSERAGEVAERWKDPKNIRRAPKPVLVALTVHHLGVEERKELLGKKDFQSVIKGSGAWAKVRKTWEKETISSFFKSMASAVFKGKVKPEVKALRWQSCSGMDQRGQQVRPPCVFFKPSLDGKHHYCGACGCGDKPLAYLDADEGGYTKLDFPHLECPLEEEGFSNYRAPE